MENDYDEVYNRAQDLERENYYLSAKFKVAAQAVEELYKLNVRILDEKEELLTQIKLLTSTHDIRKDSS